MQKVLKQLAGCAALTVMSMTVAPAHAADKVELIYSDTVPEGDIRTTILRKEFGECLGDGFDFKSYHGATLFKQGTELTAMQRAISTWATCRSSTSTIRSPTQPSWA